MVGKPAGLDATTTAVRLRGALGLAAFDIRGPAEALTLLDRYAKTLPGRPGYDKSALCGRRSKPGPWCPTPVPDTRPPAGVTDPVTWPCLEEGRSWPLGIDVQAPRAQAGQALFPPGSMLLLYTDGLIERRGESIDAPASAGRRQVVT